MKRQKIFAATLGGLMLLGGNAAFAGDKNDGSMNAEEHGTTFRNPVIFADVPDPDVIRTGDDYYMVSTTMYLMPAAPIMHSKDLVNWRIVNYIMPRMELSPRYDLVGGTVYGLGQWATSLKYYNGKYYALFAPNDTPGDTFIYTADTPEGEWKLHSRLPHYHDASLFFDDDGRVFVFHSTGLLTELSADLQSEKPGGIRTCVVVRDSTENSLLEGSRVIKHNGMYYLMMISWPKDLHRREVCYRSTKIDGPYEKKVILDTDLDGYFIGQGTIVDTPEGNWYGIVFQDRGAVGRVPTLEPCHWIDGWPMLGDEQGKVRKIMNKPVQGYSGGYVVTGDDFSGKELKLEWQWNHNPINNAWSLTDRKGWLRLRTARIVDNFFMAPNTIGQRMEGPWCSGVVKMDISKMKDGDVAGMAAMQGDAAAIAVEQHGKKKRIVATTQSLKLTGPERIVENVDVKEVASADIKGKTVWLKVIGDFNPGCDVAELAYSTDGKNFTTLIKDFKLYYDFSRLFMGTRFAIFNYATKQTGGYIDIDSFDYERK